MATVTSTPPYTDVVPGAAAAPSPAAAVQAVSGRFEGSMTAPKAGSEVLELRVDVDRRSPTSVTTTRLSGDFFAVNSMNMPGAPPRSWKVYRESWIVDAPAIAHTAGAVQITGIVKFWESTHPAATIAIQIPLTAAAIGPAHVALTFQGGTVWEYTCARVGQSFRDLELEVDVCQSVNRPPLLPAYETASHPIAPAGLPKRRLTMEAAYDEAGVGVTIRGDHTVIDDSDPQFQTWSDAELHDAMETHFTDAPLEWPRWAMWGLLAGTYEDPKVGGIMFDAAADFGGVGRPPERQGFAVFRNHRWFNALPAGAPTNDAEAEALRKYLYTWVHEAGHAFNFLHSWDKNRPDALSWMNYDWRYDTRNGPDAFWKAFEFRFDDDELLHLRHGNRASVIMGGDPWASGGHMEAPPGAEHLRAAPAAIAHAVGDVPIELLLRCKGYYEFMEPVKIEVRLRNALADVDIDVDGQLQTEFGGLIVFIRRPDGRIVEYSPVACKLSESALRTLKAGAQGADRYSEQLDVTYGRYGFYFDEPGQYLIRALYQGAGDLLIPSNTMRLRVGQPASPEIDRRAQDFFVYQVGMNLYLRGSQSPHLKQGLDFLQELCERHANTVMGAELARTIMRAVAEPFYRFEKPKGDTPTRAVLTCTKQPDPNAALRFTDKALKVYRANKQKILNLGYGDLVRQRAEYHASMGDTDAARRELTTLGSDLASRGANAPVLDDIAQLAKSFIRSRKATPAVSTKRSKPRRRGAKTE